MGSPEQIVKQASAIGLDCVAVTDHDTIKGALEALKFAKKYKILVVPGLEVSSKDGHVLALGVKKDVPKELPAVETVEKIHDLGGIAVASHPFAGFPKSAVGLKIVGGGFDAIEGWNARTATRANKKAQMIAADNGIQMIANSDSHNWKDVGVAHTIITGSDLLSAIKKGKTQLVCGHMTIYRYARLGCTKILRNLAGPGIRL